MLIRKPQDLFSSDITPEHIWRARRHWLARMGGTATGLSLAGAGVGRALAAAPAAEPTGQALAAAPNPRFGTTEAKTPFDDVTSYNNYYEFGLDKGDPARYASALKLEPWTVTVEGEVGKPGTFDIDMLRRLAPMEERVYRLRCVEGWSMVIPWIGYSLSALLKQVEPTGNARYVQFITALQPDTMPGVRSRVLDWPYADGLRMDEAMHPLAMLVFGVYGRMLPPQNGAPLRLAVPWKYWFKSVKSLARIRLTEQQPATSWVKAAAHEYGFYANVNPEVPHPRWSQATERRIGEDGFFTPKRKTLMFNGYGEQVASLYQGLDLRKNF